MYYDIVFGDNILRLQEPHRLKGLRQRVVYPISSLDMFFMYSDLLYTNPLFLPLMAQSNQILTNSL